MTAKTPPPGDALPQGWTVSIPFHIYARCRRLAALRRQPDHAEHFIDQIAREMDIRLCQSNLDRDVAAWRAERPAAFSAVMADLRTRDLLERVRASLVDPDVVRQAYAIRPQVSITKESEDFGPFVAEEDL